MSSDGHGYVAFADETAHVVRLDDFLQGKSYSFNNEKRMANWTTLKNNEPWELDVDLFYLSPAAKTKIPIGDRDIKGLHCEGWKVRDEIYWFDKQFGYLMYAEQRADNHHPYHWLMQTSKYSDLAMPDDTFKVPPGYEVRNLEEKRITLY
ncbi:MAG: hypothetical protein JST89_10645 [Cyanobacteria bacterium SZAS-4]|nr:hypothetical protein [Cyanobacteria bacterium SZAS-4]